MPDSSQPSNRPERYLRAAEVRALLESAELPVRAKEGFLHHIVCIVFISGHSIRQSEDGLTVTLHQLPERLGVAAARPAHCYRVSHLHPAWLRLHIWKVVSHS